MKLMPTIARIVKPFVLKTYGNGSKYSKGCIVVKKDYFKGTDDSEFFWVTIFGGTADFISKNSSSGSRVFIKDWNVEPREYNGKTSYDFLVKAMELIDYKKEFVKKQEEVQKETIVEKNEVVDTEEEFTIDMDDLF
jgi:hypothetical protein